MNESRVVKIANQAPPSYAELRLTQLIWARSSATSGKIWGAEDGPWLRQNNFPRIRTNEPARRLGSFTQHADNLGPISRHGKPLNQFLDDARGGTWLFFGWVCAARDSKLAPRSKKNFP